jgi:hypothetical protein
MVFPSVCLPTLTGTLDYRVFTITMRDSFSCTPMQRASCPRVTLG